MTKELKIKGMTCDHCIMHVREALESLDGVSEVNVELGNAVIDISESVDLSTLYSAIDETGYELVSVK